VRLLLISLQCLLSVPGLPAQTPATTLPPNLVSCQFALPKASGRIFVSESVQEERILDSVQPAYPSEAKRKGIQGDVMLRVIVGEDGGVEEIHLVRGSPALVEAAIKAVWQWRYEPYLLNGKPVEVETRVTVRFRLPPRSACNGKFAGSYVWMCAQTT